MSDTPETSAFIESLHDDWDVEFANLTAHAQKLERERNQWRKCAEMLADYRGQVALQEFNRLKEAQL
jgi:hypothetical protein